MKTYEYKGFDPSGKTVRGLVEALSVKEAREKLLAQKILAGKIAEPGRNLCLNTAERAELYRQIGELLSAGLPMVKALDVLIASPSVRKEKLVLAGIRDAIKDGVRLASAFRAGSPSVSTHELAVIESAEKSSMLEAMLARLAEFLDEQARLKERIQSALMYPLIVVTLGLCAGIVTLLVLVPRTKEIIGASGQAVPALTAFMMGLSAFIIKWAWLAVAVPAAAGAVIRRRIRNDAEAREKWEQFLFRTPVAGRGWSILVTQRFARTLGILMDSGVSLVEGLVLSGRATGSAWVTRLTEQVSDEVRHGSCSLSEGVGKVAPFMASLSEWVRIGETSGGVARFMNEAGERYRRDWERFVGRCLSIGEPLILVVVGGFVLAIAFSVLAPIITMSRGVGL